MTRRDNRNKNIVQFDDDLQKKLRRLAGQILILLEYPTKLYPQFLWVALDAECPFTEFEGRLREAGVAASTANELATIYSQTELALACASGAMTVRETLALARALLNGEPEPNKELIRLGRAADKVLGYFPDNKHWSKDFGLWVLEFTPHPSCAPESVPNPTAS